MVQAKVFSHGFRGKYRLLTFADALQSSSSLLRAPTSQPGHETTGGQVIEIFLRLAGPLFFGLALLALRGRIKR